MDSENLKNTLAEYQQEVRQEFADHENFMMRLYSFLIFCQAGIYDI